MSVPVIPSGAVCPSPVTNKTTYPPGAAGLVGVLLLRFRFNAAAGPEPELSNVNMAGADELDVRGKLLETWPK